jgi:hypothetical protein
MPLLIPIALVAALTLLLAAAARFGVSRRAVRGEARREEERHAEEDAEHAHLAA